MDPKRSRRLWAWAIVKTLAGLWLFFAVLGTCGRAINPYRVDFETEVTDVRFDGRPIRLDRYGSFEFSRLALWPHRVQYRDAQGRRREIEIFPRLEDDDSGWLSVSDEGVEGPPQARFVTPRE